MSSTDLNFSAYKHFSISEWRTLRHDMPLNVSNDELRQLGGINEPVSIEEVKDVYVPLAEYLRIHFNHLQSLKKERASFFNSKEQEPPFIIGLAGSVAVGKSTTARILQRILSHWLGNISVDLVTTDGFLYPNETLLDKGIMNKKGFPESYDRNALMTFLHDIKNRRPNVKCPVYSHLTYSILPDEWQVINRPEILIVEGLNVLQTNFTGTDETPVVISDYFDFSIYLDADVEVIENWYIERFLKLKETAFTNPLSYFKNYAYLNHEEAISTAKKIWTEINHKNLHENIAPTKVRADLIFHKSKDHRIDEVLLRNT